MESNFTQQEILLRTGTRFLSKEWCLKNDNGNPGGKTEKDKLEEACWNGLIQEILPELFSGEQDHKNISLWSVRETTSFLELELSEYPAAIDKHYSIDPYAIVTSQYCN